MKTRNREFNEARNKNLAQSSVTLPLHSSYNGSSQMQNRANNQSFTSSFLKKQKPDVCVTCVNKKIANEKKAKDWDERIKEKEEFRAQIAFKNAQRDIARQKRQKMLKQASDYNRSMIGNGQKMAKSQKLLDSRYISEQISKEQKEIQQQKARLQRQKEMQLKYRKDLYLQYKKEEEKKNQQKMEKKKPEINQLNITQHDKSKMIKEYSVELKRQMNSNIIKKINQKQRQVEEEKKVLQKAEAQFLKYTQFLNPEKNTHSINPEVFEDLKLIDYSKKIRKIEERQMNNKERQQYLRRQKELFKSQTQRSLRLKKDYQRELKQQMNQRYLRTAAERQEELGFPWREQKYTQDIINQSRVIKPCEECKHQYDEKCLM